MNNSSTIFDRILYIIEKKELKNIAALADILGYGSPQKIYRLKQAEDSKPSYDIISDFSNKFEDLNIRWFITGEGEAFETIQKSIFNGSVAEPESDYKSSAEVKKLKARINELEIEKKSLLLALREIGVGSKTTRNPKKDPKRKSK